MSHKKDEIRLDFDLLNDHKVKIDTLCTDIASFSDGYVKKGLFSESSSESATTLEAMLTSLVMTTQTMSSLLQQTSAYLELIGERFDEVDKEKAESFRSQ